MSDQQLWNLGIFYAKALLADLPAETAQALAHLQGRYQNLKEAAATAIAEVEAAADCRECGGQCCLNGKYRANVFDTFAWLSSDVPVTADFQKKPLCPYGTADGCTMTPGLRPSDCILFICDAIDQKLSQQARLTLTKTEQELRECLRIASSLTGVQLGTPLLLWADKQLQLTSK